MKRSARGVLASLLVLALASTLVVGCQPTPEPETDAGDKEEVIKAGMVTDIGGLGDKSFNDLSYEGLKRAEEELGVEIKALSSKAPTDYDSNIAQLTNAEYDVVFCVGFLMTDAISKAATDFPDIKFGGIDIYNDHEETQPNRVGLSFKEQEAGYLAGVTAGLLTKETSADSRINDKNVIGFVGGMPIPPVKKFEAGFIAGAKSVNPDVTILRAYCGATPSAFTDQGKGKEIALSQISQGADIVFAAAGQSGIGSFQACKEKNALFIGVDSDQYNTLPTPGDTIITSAMKKVDVAVFDTIKSIQDGTFEGGNGLWGLKEDGVDLAPWHEFEDKVPQKLKDAIEKAKKDVIDGKVTVPEDPDKA